MQISSKQKTVLIVGGAGYIGSVLTRIMLDAGYNVRVLDNLLYNNASAVSDLLSNTRFSFIRGDFCDSTTLKESLSGITDVVLLAALVGDPICKKYPDEARRVNLEGSIHLIEELGHHEMDRFIFLSTCSNYGPREDDKPAHEESELNPQSLYAETKVNVERYLRYDIDAFNFCPIILRSATAFGLSPRMRFDLTVPEFTRELTLGRELVVYDENTWRPYCHVADISEAIMLVIGADSRLVRGEVFNVGSSSENHTKREIVEIICGKINDCRIIYRQGGIDPRNYRVLFDKIATILGFSNKYKVADSIDELIREIRNGRFEDIESNKAFYGNYYLRQ